MAPHRAAATAYHSVRMRVRRREGIERTGFISFSGNLLINSDVNCSKYSSGTLNGLPEPYFFRMKSSSFIIGIPFFVYLIFPDSKGLILGFKKIAYFFSRHGGRRLSRHLRWCLICSSFLRISFLRNTLNGIRRVACPANWRWLFATEAPFRSIEIFVGRQLADDGRRGIVQSGRVFFRCRKFRVSLVAIR